jgi:hypothetical protein
LLGDGLAALAATQSTKNPISTGVLESQLDNLIGLSGCGYFAGYFAYLHLIISG